jgi:hypothetical protein
MSHRDIAPRLLTKEQAAAYCGVSAVTFEAVCPLKPVSLGDSVRLRRYDLKALDEWLDRLGTPSTPSGKDWLAAMERKHDGGSRARS